MSESKTSANDVLVAALALLREKGVLILLGFIIILFFAWSKIDRIEVFLVNIANAVLHGG